MLAIPNRDLWMDLPTTDVSVQISTHCLSYDFAARDGRNIGGWIETVVGLALGLFPLGRLKVSTGYIIWRSCAWATATGVLPASDKWRKGNERVHGFKIRMR
jgi:hypothetical protein